MGTKKLQVRLKDRRKAVEGKNVEKANKEQEISKEADIVAAASTTAKPAAASNVATEDDHLANTAA